MITLGLILLIAGIIIAFGSFIFMLLNMGKVVKKTSQNRRMTLTSMFTGHIAGMIGMATGALVGTVGILLICIYYIPILISMI